MLFSRRHSLHEGILLHSAYSVAALKSVLDTAKLHHPETISPNCRRRVPPNAYSVSLLGAVHALREVSTHAPVPELASERVACTLDCRGLNRDPCWLKANKCGECSEGFVGKAGHVNSPCGKVHALLCFQQKTAITRRVVYPSLHRLVLESAYTG